MTLRIKVVITIALVLFLGLTSFFYENKVFYIHFVDEEDNFVLGKYLVGGERLYSDLFSHHQPLAYIISAGIQQTVSPNSLYLLTKRHREFIIFYAIVFILFLYFRFDWQIALFAGMFETIKFYFLGNLFLSETLSMYPLGYLALLSWKVFLERYEISLKEYLLLGFMVSFIMLMLAPLWPVIGFLTLLIFIRLRKGFFLKSGLFILGFLPCLYISIYYSSIPIYFHNVFYINLTYYIPTSGADSVWVNLIKSFATPFTPFLPSNEPGIPLLITRILSGTLILFLGILIFRKKYLMFAVLFITLGLTNIRYSTPGQAYFNAFHTLPWLLLACLSISYIAGGLASTLKIRKTVIIVYTLIAVNIVSFVFLGFSKDSLFIMRDIQKDQYINYSRQFDFGEAIRIAKTSEDRLFVVPDEWLLYWQADIPHASYMVNYYPWMSQVPEIRNNVDNMFLTNPPEFFYCESCDENDMTSTSQYRSMKKDSKNSKLLVLKKKTLTDKQREQLRFLNFNLD